MGRLPLTQRRLAVALQFGADGLDDIAVQVIGRLHRTLCGLAEFIAGCGRSWSRATMGLGMGPVAGRSVVPVLDCVSRLQSSG